MNWVDNIGVIGCFLFFIKIGIHIYLKLKVDRKFYIGASGHFTNPVLFFPISDDVLGHLKKVKKVGNIIYLIAISFILIFVVGTSLHLGKNIPK